MCNMYQFISVNSNQLVHTRPGQRVKQIRDKEQQERKIDIKESIEQDLCSLVYNCFTFIHHTF